MVLKDENIQFEVKAKINETFTFEGILKEMLEQIKLVKELKALNRQSKIVNQASINSNVGKTNTSGTKVGRFVNHLDDNTKKNKEIVFTENVDDFNEGRTPCIMITTIPLP